MKARLSGEYLIAEGLDDHAFGEAILSDYEAWNEWYALMHAWHFCFYTEWGVHPTIH